MAFVKQLNIKEFRGIKECNKPLEFSKFNVLLGRNNSGKSAVLQALSLLPHPISHQPMELRIGGRPERFALIRYLTGDDKSVIYRYAGTASLDFMINEKKYHITLDDRGNRRGIADTSEVDPPRACQYLGLKAEENQNWAVFVPNESNFLREIEVRLSSEWAMIEKSESNIRVVREVINPVIDENFTEVLRSDHELWVRKEVRGKPFRVNVRDLGDGVEKTLNILLFLEVCAPKLVLWDDFEISAHPSLVKRLLWWLDKKGWQVVLATHSIDVLYELAEIKPKDAVIIQLKKTEDDTLTYNTLTLDQLEDSLSAGHDPRLLVDVVK